MNKKTREAVYQKYNGHCAYCGKEIEYKDRVITGLTISDGKTDRFTMHGTDYTPPNQTDFSAAEKKLAEAKTQDELVAAWTSLSGQEKLHCETLKDLRKGELTKS